MKRTNNEIKKEIVDFLATPERTFLEHVELYTFHEDTLNISVGETMRLDQDSIAFQDVWCANPDKFGLTQVLSFSKEGIHVTNVLFRKEGAMTTTVNFPEESSDDDEGEEG